MLNIKRFALAGGILWGGALLLITLAGLVTPADYAETFFDFFSFYPGYSRTILGALLGLVWGFIDGFLAGMIFAWIYNKLGKRA